MSALYGSGNYGAGVYGQDSTFTLTAAEGACASTGEGAGLLWKHLLAGAEGAFNLTGELARLLAGHVLAAAKGAYALTGEAAADTIAMAAAAGGFALAGQAAGLLTGDVWSADAVLPATWTASGDGDGAWAPAMGNSIFWTKN